MVASLFLSGLANLAVNELRGAGDKASGAASPKTRQQGDKGGFTAFLSAADQPGTAKSGVYARGLADGGAEDATGDGGSILPDIAGIVLPVLPVLPLGALLAASGGEDALGITLKSGTGESTGLPAGAANGPAASRTLAALTIDGETLGALGLGADGAREVTAQLRAGRALQTVAGVVSHVAANIAGRLGLEQIGPGQTGFDLAALARAGLDQDGNGTIPISIVGSERSIGLNLGTLRLFEAGIPQSSSGALALSSQHALAVNPQGLANGNGLGTAQLNLQTPGSVALQLGAQIQGTEVSANALNVAAGKLGESADSKLLAGSSAASQALLGGQKISTTGDISGATDPARLNLISPWQGSDEERGTGKKGFPTGAPATASSKGVSLSADAKALSGAAVQLSPQVQIQALQGSEGQYGAAGRGLAQVGLGAGEASQGGAFSGAGTSSPGQSLPAQTFAANPAASGTASPANGFAGAASAADGFARSDAIGALDSMVDRLVAAREGKSPAEAALALQHKDFGVIDLRFRQDSAGRLAVELSAQDGELARALSAASQSDASGSNSRQSEQQSSAHNQRARLEDSALDSGSEGHAAQQNFDEARDQGGERSGDGRAQSVSAGNPETERLDQPQPGRRGNIYA